MTWHYTGRIIRQQPCDEGSQSVPEHLNNEPKVLVCLVRERDLVLELTHLSRILWHLFDERLLGSRFRKPQALKEDVN